LLALPIFRSSCENLGEALDRTRPRGSSPTRSRRVAWLRDGSFCKEGCGAAAQDVMNLSGLQIGSKDSANHEPRAVVGVLTDVMSLAVSS
jgi:hypothetical protein